MKLMSLRSSALVASAAVATLAFGLAAPGQAADHRTGKATAGTAATGGERRVKANPTLREVADRTGRFVGTAVSDGRLGDATYTNIAKSEFSSVTAENAMKWGSVEPNRGQFN
ncbi:endo-1,4-beta-xylanase, partial [Streptomyces sp. MCAF7]